VHGVGGALGIVLLGLFASTAFNPAGTDGLFGGNPGFLVKQLVAIILSSVWAFSFTYGMLWLIDFVTQVKVEQTDEERGLDVALHGETAYLGTD
jgi:Amt family ammonium transporter